MISETNQLHYIIIRMDSRTSNHISYHDNKIYYMVLHGH